MDASRNGRLGEMQIKREEQKHCTRILYGETEQGEAELINGRIEDIFGESPNSAGLARTKYRDWRGAEKDQTGKNETEVSTRDEKEERNTTNE